jgi:hypothetical protein
VKGKKDALTRKVRAVRHIENTDKEHLMSH